MAYLYVHDQFEFIDSIEQINEIICHGTEFFKNVENKSFTKFKQQIFKFIYIYISQGAYSES